MLPHSDCISNTSSVIIKENENNVFTSPDASLGVFLFKYVLIKSLKELLNKKYSVNKFKLS